MTAPTWYALPLREGDHAIVRSDTVTAVLVDVLVPGGLAEVHCGTSTYRLSVTVEVVLRDLGICARVVGGAR